MVTLGERREAVRSSCSRDDENLKIVAALSNNSR